MSTLPDIMAELEAERGLLGLSTRKLAARLGVTRHAAECALTPYAGKQVRTVERLADALGYRLCYKLVRKPEARR